MICPESGSLRLGLQSLSESVTVFVWDEWLPVAEYGVGYTNYMTWGNDLSGTMQGAGGVGGLAAISLNGTNAFPLYDNNGNVVALVTEGGEMVAWYKYSSFGECVAAEGPLAQANPFRWSTKYHDDETGLDYYGYRFYSPQLGRWLNRDPIGEKGGDNLYLFVRNNPSLHYDSLGLVTCKEGYEFASRLKACFDIPSGVMDCSGAIGSLSGDPDKIKKAQEILGQMQAGQFEVDFDLFKAEATDACIEEMPPCPCESYLMNCQRKKALEKMGLKYGDGLGALQELGSAIGACSGAIGSIRTCIGA